MSLNIIFMGTPEFSVPTLNALVDSKYNIRLVVTQEDKPKGRGKKVSFPPIKKAAVERNLELLQPRDLKNEMVYNKLKEKAPDLIVTIAFGKKIPGKILDLPGLGCINIHASLLPKYRGGAPIHWAVMNGEKETGLTIMSMDTGMDTGGILAQESIPIYFEDTTGMVHDRLAKAAPDLLLETIPEIKKGHITPKKQDETKASMAEKLSNKHLKIKWQEETSLEVYNKIRGLNPWPGAFTFLNGRRLKLWFSRIYDEKKVIGSPGEIIELKKNGPVVQCREGLIILTSIQPEGKKALRSEDFLKGYHVNKGDILEGG